MYSASKLFEVVQRHLNDSGASGTWVLADICALVTEALYLLALLRPDSTSRVESFQVAQNIRQELPTGGSRLLDVLGNVDGRPIRRIDRKVLDETIPDWRTQTTSTQIEHFIYEEATPKYFWVYPKPIANLYIEISLSGMPPEFTTTATVLGVDETFITPVLEWVYYRCLSEEREMTSKAVAFQHRSDFFSILGVKNQTDATLFRLLNEVKNG